MSVRWLLTHIKKPRRRTWQFHRIHHDTHAFLNVKHISYSIQSKSLKIIILSESPSNSTLLRCVSKSSNVRCPSSFGDPVCSWLWFPFPDCFLLSLSFFFYLWAWADYDIVLSLTYLTIRECLFATGPEMYCSSDTLVSIKTGLLCADSSTSIAVSIKLSLFPTLGLKPESFAIFSFVLRVNIHSKVVWHSIRFSTFHKIFTNRSNGSSLDLVITRELLDCIPVVFNFLDSHFSRAQTGLIQHQMLSHVLWSNFTHVDCPSNFITYAFTWSCRVLLSIFCSVVEDWFVGLMTWILVPVTDSRDLSHIEQFVLSRRTCHTWKSFSSSADLTWAHASSLQSNAISVYNWSERSRSSLVNRDFRKSWFMLTSIFLKPLLITRTVIKKEPFLLKKTCLFFMIWSHL